MCGFAGISFNDTSLINTMGGFLSDRAVDKEYYHVEDNLAFYHAHLSVSDVDKDTSQPLIYNDIVIGFVGEIYNKGYLLSQCGIEESEDAYTELQCLAFAYEKFGKDFINRVNGEFAVFLYDKKIDTYFLFRDRWGTNLVYYTIVDGELYFASEIKSLMIHDPKLNIKGMSEYLTFQYVISPNTLVKGIFSLPPARILEFSHSKELSISEFSPYVPQEESSSLIETLERSVIRRIPHHQKQVFVSLSGGPDSNFILYVLQKYFQGEVIAFSFENETNKEEIEYARYNAKLFGVKHLIVDMDIHDNVLELEDTILVHEGLVDMPDIHKVLKSQYPEYKDIKVAFAGDGKEELILSNDHYPYEEIYPRYKYFKEKGIIDEHTINNEFLNLSLFDFNLQLYDKVSLRNGVEVRMPFTDYELLRYYKYDTYKTEMELYLSDLGMRLIPSNDRCWGFGHGMKFQYHYDKELLFRQKLLFEKLREVHLSFTSA